jgi:hypothetical protein
LRQDSNALDTYYNDNAFYPSSLQGILNSKEHGNYINAVPHDPAGGVNGGYKYMVDPDDQRPQWFAMFGKMENTKSAKSFCALEKTGCVPADYDTSGYNLCVYGGSVDCNVISGLNLSNL